MKNDQLVIITGMSGAGKTLAMQTFEDLGYFCVDNLPPQLITKFTQMLRTSSEINKVALVVDLRAPGSGQTIVNSLVRIAKDDNKNESVIFLDASDKKIVSRYEESRRNHPLARNGRVIDGIKKERDLMRQVKENANLVINTTDLSPKELKNKIVNSFDKNNNNHFHVELMSFGFKNGLPIDADMVFDVRFLQNPFYVPELRNKTGLDEPVYDYVMKQNEADEYFRKMYDLVKFVLTKINKSAKASETIAIGCTGGQHRSVAMTERLAQALSKLGFTVNVTHRDIKSTKEHKNNG